MATKKVAAKRVASAGEKDAAKKKAKPQATLAAAKKPAKPSKKSARPATTKSIAKKPAKAKPATATAKKPTRPVAKAAAKTATSARPATKKATKKATPTKAASAAKKSPSATTPATPRLLAGGNPQIAKGYGEAPIQAYLAAIPGWKREVAMRVDALVTRTVPGVQKAVKWNSPLYGLGNDRWFLSFHCYDRYLKVAFFRGSALDPPPPEPSKMAGNRYLHLREGQPFDETQLASWIRQAAALPGEKM